MNVDFLSIEVTESSVDEAVDRGLALFDCSRAEVITEILQVPTSGFLGLIGKKRARVRVRLTDRAFIAKRFTEKLLMLSGLEGEIRVAPGRHQIDLQIECSDSSLVIGRHGQTLDALQSLVSTLTDRHVEDRTPIVIDADNYRRRRIESLKTLARRLSRQVRRSGRSTTLHPLPPEERRILHKALEEENGIVSRSIGGGYERKMIISCRGD